MMHTKTNKVNPAPVIEEAKINTELLNSMKPPDWHIKQTQWPKLWPVEVYPMAMRIPQEY